MFRQCYPAVKHELNTRLLLIFPPFVLDFTWPPGSLLQVWTTITYVSHTTVFIHNSSALARVSRMSGLHNTYFHYLVRVWVWSSVLIKHTVFYLAHHDLGRLMWPGAVGHFILVSWAQERKHAAETCFSVLIDLSQQMNLPLQAWTLLGETEMILRLNPSCMTCFIVSYLLLETKTIKHINNWNM